MSNKSLQQQSSIEQDTEQYQPIVMASNASQVDRMQAIQQLNTWLEGQSTRLAAVNIMTQQAVAHGILQALENAWVQYERSGYLFEMPASTGMAFNQESAGIFLPTELTANIRPIIEVAEAAGAANSEKAASGVDWNTRLGIPEYRTQSDNLVAPEASCNVTTLAMILERMGIGRDQVVAALENRMGIQLLESPESRSETWVEDTLSYINRQMRSPKAYQRVRGEGYMSNNKRSELAGDYQDNAQMEDLLDLLLHQMGQSRTSAVSEPDRLLEELTRGQPTPSSDKIWGGGTAGKWDNLAPRVRECIINGGGAALSFRHKGTRSRGTHIVSILAVQNDGFLVDDPYGDIRDDYMGKGYDDAYWSRNENGSLIHSRDRSDQRNETAGIDDWGTAWARELREEENKGQETIISKAQVESSMFYVQLFHRGKPDTVSSAPRRSQRPQARGPHIE
jgi:hypothetical protein